MVGGLLSIGVIDVLDILLVAFIIYWVLLFIRGTRAVQILFGLLILMVMYVVAKKAGMVTFQWLVGNFLENLLVVLVVVFHSEIRRGLAKIGQWRLFGGRGSAPDPDVIDQLAQSAFLLAAERIGAILLLEREMGLEEFVEHGKKLDAHLLARAGRLDLRDELAGARRGGGDPPQPDRRGGDHPPHPGRVGRDARDGHPAPRGVRRGVRNGRRGGRRLRGDGERHGLLEPVGVPRRDRAAAAGHARAAVAQGGGAR